jgi:hypothetical protein
MTGDFVASFGHAPHKLRVSLGDVPQYEEGGFATGFLQEIQ